MSDNQKKYCFDTNCFIEPWNRYYSYKSHESYWDDFLLSKIKKGDIIILREIYIEIEKKDDDLLNWVKKHKLNTKVVETDRDLTHKVRDLLVKYPRLVDSRKGRSAADPFLIEYARRENITLVTFESKTGNLNKPNIPDVCDSENIKWISFYDYIKILGVSFILKK